MSVNCPGTASYEPFLGSSSNFQDSAPFPFFLIFVLFCEHLPPHQGMKKAEMGSALLIVPGASQGWTQKICVDCVYFSELGRTQVQPEVTSEQVRTARKFLAQCWPGDFFFFLNHE